MKNLKTKINESGLSLLEVVIAIAILAFVSMSLYGLFDFTLKVIWENKARTGAQVLGNQYMETVYNLPYLDVGTQGGIPSGSLVQTASTTLNNIHYIINTSVIYIDDPFDGSTGGSPNDALPSDYKRVRVEITWNFRLQDEPVVFVSDIAPKGLESELGGGTLRITALDSLGQPVPQASIYIVNNSTTPVIDFNTQTNDEGLLVLPGATSSVETYQVWVTKNDFSLDQTYGVDPVALPTSIRPHLTVLEGEVTDASFSIDMVSQMHFSTVLAQDACGITQAPSRTNLAAAQVLPSQHRPSLAFSLPNSGANFRIALNDQIYVDGLSGSDVTGDGSAGNPYASLTRALQDVDEGEGDIINLAGAQTYTEGPLTLATQHSGATSTPTIIQAWPGTATPTVSTLGSSVFTFNDIRNIVINGLAFTGASSEGILIQNNAINVEIKNSLASGNAVGIRFNGGEMNSLTSNTVANNSSHGLVLNSRINTVQKNIFHDNGGTGIVISSTSNDIIENTIYGNDLGIDVGTSDNLVNNNDVYQHVQSGIYVHHSSGQNTVTNNTSYSNGTYGLRITGTGTSLVNGNEVYSNPTRGVYLAASGNTLSGNILRNNPGGGVYIGGGNNTMSGDQLYENGNNGLEAVNGDDNSFSSLVVRNNSLVGILLSNCDDCSLNNSQVYGNTSHGLDLDDSLRLVINNNKIYGNGGSGLHINSSHDAYIHHNLIYEQGGLGIFNSGGDDNIIESNTIVDNSTDGISLVSAAVNNTIKNNIIAFNGGRGLDDNDDQSEPVDSYNIFYNNSLGDLRNLMPVIGGTGTATGTDPLFVDRAGDDYHLQSVKGYFPFGPGDVSSLHSPALDAGDEVTAYTNEPSPNGCLVNLGAYGNTSEASKSQSAGDPIPNLPFTLRGSKLKGWDSGGLPVYKHEISATTDANGQLTITNMEWDTYEIMVSTSTTGYDIAYVDPHLPINLLPNTSKNVQIGLAPDTQHSLRLLVLDSLDGLPEQDAQVRLYNAGFGYDETKTTPTHGQVFFEDLTVGTYTLEVTKSGFQFYQANVDVAWDTADTVTLTP